MTTSNFSRIEVLRLSRRNDPEIPDSCRPLRSSTVALSGPSLLSSDSRHPARWRAGAGGIDHVARERILGGPGSSPPRTRAEGKEEDGA